ncbi:MAG TPA: flagellar biosynthesis anti-sigma factor FlgM [Thermoguttaceae bacterium]|nr:flagellar biosynthesis anti-sigma factor FlgM [Thermoguttaceae bacterium]
MHIHGPSHLHGPQPIGPPHASRVARPEVPATSNPIQDELSLSDAARFVDQVKQMPDVRQDRVDAIRRQIEAGTYETPEKLDMALERLLDEIG